MDSIQAISEFLSNSQAREKLMRTVQYACVLAGHVNEHTCSSRTTDRLQALVSHLKMSRKLLRLGRSVDCLHALHLSARLPDPVLRLCLSSAHVTRALYFACDNLLWARKMRLARNLDSERWGVRAARCYLLSLIACLMRDLYEVIVVVITIDDDETVGRISPTPAAARRAEATAAREFVLNLPQTKMTTAAVTRRGGGGCRGAVVAASRRGEPRRRPELWLDVAKNLLDLVSPLERLGVCRAHAGVTGLCGLVSSILGLAQLTTPGLKLRP